MAGGAQSLYRKHRPRSFADVVGQDPVVRTLRHAVERGKVHHAYLFVGSRGTGKTSMAKILASCLNCDGAPTRPDGARAQPDGVSTQPDGVSTQPDGGPAHPDGGPSHPDGGPAHPDGGPTHTGGPTIDPCGVCDSCRSIASATSLDVIEMDAASNNSVDDIRELRDSVAFAPVSGRHKVYILDEAHMLSQAAWNAFLKTLEEPPPNTVFVLATTEAVKVPATVVDRCHRFDFHRPTVEQIASVVMRAARAESIEIPPEAVAAIARSATGSFRDALGTLEQLVTYSGTRVELEDVLAVLGVADEQLLADAFNAVAAGDARGALLAVARCADGGRDAGSFTRDLEGRARELLIVQTLEEVPLELSLTPEIDERLRAQAQRVGRAEVVRVLDLLGAALEAVRAGADPRTQLELALVKAATPQTDGSTRALLARIERLEQALAGNPSPERPAPPPGPSTRPEAPPTAPESSPTAEEKPESSPTAEEKPESSPTAEEEPESSPTVEAPESSPVVEASETPGVAPVVVEAPEQQSTAAPVAVATPTAVSDLDALWPAVHEAVGAEHGLLGAVLNEAVPATLTDEELVLAFPPTAAFHKRKAEDPDNRAMLADTLRRVSGRRYRVTFELREDLLSQEGLGGGAPTEEEVMARLMAELDAVELPEDWLTQQKGE